MMGSRCYVLLRRRYDVPIRRRDAPLRRLGDVPSRLRWVFHLRRTCNVAGTYRETSLRHRHDVLMPGGERSRYLWFNKKERQNTTKNLLRKILSTEALNYLEEVLNYIRALVPNDIDD